MKEPIKTQAEKNVEMAESTRDRALQKVKDLEAERAQVIARKDEIEALRFSEAIAKAKVKAEIEEVRVKQTQETLEKVNANKPKASKALSELQELWSKYQQATIDTSTLRKNADAKAAELPSLHSAMMSKISEYESLSGEKIIGVPPSPVGRQISFITPPEDLTWKPETDLERQMRRYR